MDAAGGPEDLLCSDGGEFTRRRRSDREYIRSGIWYRQCLRDSETAGEIYGAYVLPQTIPLGTTVTNGPQAG